MVANLELVASQAQAFLSQGDADSAKPLVAALQQVARTTRTAQIAAQTAIIGFPLQARRSPAQIVTGRAPDPGMIDLVAFHVDLPRAPSGIHKPIDYMKVLQLAFQAAAIKAPSARRIILTDEATVIPADAGAQEIRRFPLDPGSLMYERMRLQRLYLQGRPVGRASVFMDTDVVVNRDPAEVFQRQFDVALTWRTGFPDAPFNGGLIFAGPGEGAYGFISDALACYDQIAASPALAGLFSRSLKGWWGDQFALAALVGYRQFAQRQSDGATINDALVAYLPCATFNFTLDAGNSYSPADLRQKYCVHFKGNRKHLLARYVDLIRQGLV
jgi:hypothetical protein